MADPKQSQIHNFKDVARGPERDDEKPLGERLKKLVKYKPTENLT
ncbi:MULTISPECIES: hypothetical protein [unclassified Mesorhizobium]